MAPTLVRDVRLTHHPDRVDAGGNRVGRQILHCHGAAQLARAEEEVVRVEHRLVHLSGCWGSGAGDGEDVVIGVGGVLVTDERELDGPRELVIARDGKRRPVRGRGRRGRQRDQRRRCDREVGDGSDRSVVDPEKHSVARVIDLVEAVDELVGVVSRKRCDLQGSGGGRGGSREPRTFVAGHHVFRLLSLHDVLVPARRLAVVVVAAGDVAEVADVEVDEAAELRAVVRLAGGPVDLERRALEPGLVACWGSAVVAERVGVDLAAGARSRGGEHVDEGATRTGRRVVAAGNKGQGGLLFQHAPRPGTDAERLDAEQPGDGALDVTRDRDAHRCAGDDDAAHQLVRVEKAAAVLVLVDRWVGHHAHCAGRRALHIHAGDAACARGGRADVGDGAVLERLAGSECGRVRRLLEVATLGHQSADVDRQARDAEQDRDADGDEDEHLPPRRGSGALHQFITIAACALISNSPLPSESRIASRSGTTIAWLYVSWTRTRQPLPESTVQ